MLASATPAQAQLYTVAGTGVPGSLGDGGPAGAAAIGPSATVAALPGGGFVIGERGRVRTVDASGRIRTIAGTGRPGHAGDGGPATEARVDPSAIAVAADGSLLIGQCEQVGDAYSPEGRVRRIAPDGMIVTVAGGRSEPRGDGGPATLAGLRCPVGLAALSDGGFLVADSEDERVRRVDPGGTIRTVAGTGELPDARLSGSAPAVRVAVHPRGLAVTNDGRVLIADNWACSVLELRPDGLVSVVAGSGLEGRREDDGRAAIAASVCPTALAALPDGGFLLADEGSSSLVGEEPSVRRVGADGRIATIAGSRRFVPNPPRLIERRGDGGPPRGADLRPITALSLTPDGGVLIAEGVDWEDDGVQGLVRYLAPSAPALLASAIVRDADRFFTPGAPAVVTVAASAPATVTLTVGSATVTAAVGPGISRIALPVLSKRKPYRVALTATDAAGRVAADRTDLFPRGWLPVEVAGYAAAGLAFRATPWGSLSGDPVTGCRRFSPARLDCGLTDDGGDRCKIAVTIRLGADRRMRWGAYRCPLRARPRLQRRLRPFVARDTSCEISDTSCATLSGRLTDRRLLPWD